MEKLAGKILKSVENLQWEIDRMSEDGRAEFNKLWKNAILLRQQTNPAPRGK